MKTSIVVIVLSILFLIASYCYIMHRARTALVSGIEVDIKKVSRLMRYHGTRIVIVKDGKYYFIRNGKLVPLWDPEDHNDK